MARTKEQGGEGMLHTQKAGQLVSLELRLRAAEGTKEERGQGPGHQGW